MKSLNARPWQPECWITASGVVCNPQHVRDILPQRHTKCAALTTALVRRITNTRDVLNCGPWLPGYWITGIGTLADADPCGTLPKDFIRAAAVANAAIRRMMLP